MSTSLAPSHKRASGLTLVEILFSLVLFLMLVTMMIPAATYLSHSGEVMVSNVSHHGEARRFLEQLGLDLRVTTDLSVTQTDGTTSDTVLTLTTMDPSGASHTVVYQYLHELDQVFRKVDTGNREVLLDNIVSIFYKFYDGTGTQTTTESQIKMVEASLVFKDEILDYEATQTMNSARYVLRNRAVN